MKSIRPIIKTDLNPEFNNLQTIHDKIFNNSKTQVALVNGLFLTQVVQIDGTSTDQFWNSDTWFCSEREGISTESRKNIFILYAEGATKNYDILCAQIKLTNVDLNNPKANCREEQKRQLPRNSQTGSKGLLNLFLLGIAGGLIAFTNPCVFPMIPVTVSFFTNKAKTKQREEYPQQDRSYGFPF